MNTSKFLLTALFLLSAVLAPINAQDDPHIYWEYLPTPGEDDGDDEDRYFAGCAQDTIDGYYYCATYSGENHCGDQSEWDISIVKFDEDGNEVGQVYLCDLNGPNNGTQYPFDMVYSDGYLYMIAEGYVTDGSEGSNNTHILVKIDFDNGPVLWTKQIYTCEGECQFSEPQSIKIDNQGNIVIGGSAYFSYTYDGDTSSDWSTWIAKYDTDGNEIWTFLEHLQNYYFDYTGHQGERLYEIEIASNNDILFGGYTSNNYHDVGVIGRLSPEGFIIWAKELPTIGIDFNRVRAISELPNGDIFVGGIDYNGNYPAIGKVDGDGNFIAYRHLAECYNEPTYMCQGEIYDSFISDEGKIVFSGMSYFTNVNWFSEQGLVYVANSDLEYVWVEGYGEVGSDKFTDVFQDENGSILASGYVHRDGHQKAIAVKLSYATGCTDIESCNYNQYADYDDGSCWQPLESCTCDDPEDAVDDICGECNGNGYDTCDDDDDGTSNYDQWGYGAYDITITDIPDDYGGAVYLSFHGSFHDDGIDEGEFYTIERNDSTGWVSLNSISAYGQETYTTEASTQFDGDTTEFRVIASLSEGTFISTVSGYGASIDNNTVTGCMDINACNYNSQAIYDDGSCTYPDEYYDCDGNCLSDLDFDGLCDELDTCPLDSLNDADGDGVCGDVDLCEGFDDNVDTDMDGIADGCDACPLDSLNDADGDGVCGDVDLCEGYDDNIDLDGDGVIDGCEVFGCVDTVACNYDELATEDDSTCFYGYIYCIDLDGDGLGDPEYCYTQCDLTDPIDFYVQNNDDLCPDDPDNDLDGDGICGDVDACPLDSLNDIDGDGLCADADACPFDYDNDLDGDGICACTIDSITFCPPDFDWCPDDSLNDANDNGICDSYEVYGCMDILSCNFDSTANVDDGSCEYESCLDCAGELFGEATLDSCGLCAGGNTGIDPHDQCWPIIDDIVDVPNDQGGRVYLYFTPSSLDTDSLTQRTELYSVERLDPIEGGTDSVWVNVASGPAYGLGEYVFEVTTLVDSNDFQPGITAFRVLASMDEGIWASDIAYGYSTDDIAPLPPTGLIALVVDSSIILTWDHTGVDDFDHYIIYRSTDSEFVVNEDNILDHTNDTTFTDADIVENTIYYYMVTSTDYNGNVSDPSNLAEGTVYVNYAPTIETIDDLTTDEDTPIAIDLQVSDVNGDSLTFEINSSDENVIPQLDGLTLNLDLVENWNGSSDITITVSDSEFDVTEVFTLNVNPVNDAPQSFSTIAPVSGTIISITPETIGDTLFFAWEQSIDVDEDELIYSILGIDQLVMLSADSINAETYSVPFINIAEMMQQNELTIISGTWKVSVHDQDYLVYSDDIPELTIDLSLLGIDLNGLPTSYALHQNYPNPFNPITTLRYDLPEHSYVNVTVYDMLGREVKTLVNTTQDAGFKSVIWDATNEYGNPVSAGVYLYKIQAGEFVQTRKMVLLK